MAFPRNSSIEISYNGTDITNAIGKYFLDFTHEDNGSNEADSISVNLHDRDGFWHNDWYFDIPGAKIKAKIKIENWNSEDDIDELDCGEFEIASPDFSGPPDVMSIKGVSTPISSSIRREEKTKSWEDTTLEKIAQDISSEADLQLMYEVESDIQLDRIDQWQKSDMSFLQELCDEYGVSLKVTGGKLVLFEEYVYEQRDVVDTFDKSDVGGKIKSFFLSQDTTDTVSKVISTYKDPKSGQLVEAEFTPPNPPSTGQIERINKRPGDLRGDDFRNGVDTASGDPDGTFDTGFCPFNETVDDFENVRSDTTDNALRQCKAVARKKNKKEWIGTLTMIGHVKMISGLNIGLTNWGKYNGKWAIDNATHKVADGYTTVIKIHRVLEGY